MKIAILLMPKMKQTQRLIVDELSHLGHEFLIIEQPIPGVKERLEMAPQSNVKQAELPVMQRNGEPPPPLLPPEYDDAVLRLLREEGAEQLISFSDQGVLSAARIRERLALRGNSAASELRIVDKEATRRCLTADGLSQLEFRASSVHTLLEDAVDFPYPAIVKPASFSASIGVQLIEHEQDLHRYLETCRTSSVFRQGKVVIEQFLPGPEFSVEGIVVGDRPCFLGVTESHTTGAPHFVGSGHDFLAEHARRNSIYAYTERVIHSLGMRDCPFHIEMKRTPDGYEVIEAHSRFAGAMIMEIVREATGVYPFAHFVQTLLGMPFEQPWSDPRVFSQHLFCAPPGTVHAALLDPEILSDPRTISYSLDLPLGRRLPGGILPWLYLGHINFRSDNVEQAQSFRGRAARALALTHELEA